MTVNPFRPAAPRVRTGSPTAGSARRVTLPALLAVAALGFTACASAGTSTSAGSSAGPDLGNCGKVPSVAAKGDTAALASLPSALRQSYNGFTTPVTASAWANWKPDHAGPFKVAIAWQPSFNAFQTDTLAGLTSALKASGKVDIIANVSTTSLTDVPAQLQQFNELVSRKPDLIVIEPLAAEPLVSAFAAAAKAGIPVVSAWNVVNSPNAVSVGINNFLQAATVASKVVVKMGGKGEVLKVHGIPGIPQDTEAQAGFDAVLASCPNIKVAGQVTGNYSGSDTKAATLQFLATHPGTIAGVLQSGTMTTGVLDAFGQLGRPVPVIADMGSSKGSIAYAHDHASDYEVFGTSGADTAIGRTFGKVALRILAGDGPKLAQIVTEQEYITAANLNSVYQPGWTTTTPGDAAAKDDPFITDQNLSSFFARTS